MLFPTSPRQTSFRKFASGLIVAIFSDALLWSIYRQSPSAAIGAITVLWFGWTTWTCGFGWAAGLWITGLVCTASLSFGIKSEVESIEIVLLTALAGSTGYWVRAVQRRLKHEHRQARLDSLTGLPNRQAFHEQCAAEISRARRFQRPFSLILLDGDRFKELNDREGHAAGDAALSAVARGLSRGIREYDHVARLGGDEFIVLLPETASSEAEQISQRLQESLQSEISSSFAPLTFSQGVMTFYPGTWTVSQCLHQVDHLLYEAKRTGPGTVRNQIVQAT